MILLTHVFISTPEKQPQQGSEIINQNILYPNERGLDNRRKLD